MLLITITVAGCADPYSQKRISMRQEKLRGQAESAVTQERHNAQRLQEEGPTLRRWWQADVEQFNERAPKVGDYVW